MSQAVILKFDLEPSTEVPAGDLLKVGFQGKHPRVWVEIKTDGNLDKQTLIAVPTGDTFDTAGLEFVDTAIGPDLVLHVYRRL